MGPRNHVLNWGQDQTNPFTAVMGPLPNSFGTFVINHILLLLLVDMAQTLSLCDHRSVSETFHGCVILVSPMDSFNTHLAMTLSNSALLKP